MRPTPVNEPRVPMRFANFVIDGPGNPASLNEMMAADAFNDRLNAGGHLLLAAGIADPSRETVFDNRSDEGIERPGSLQDAPECYSGLWNVDVKTANQAASIARDGSAAFNGRVGLRPLL